MQQLLFLALMILPIMANATVTKVTVYPRGATLTDERELAIGKGVNEINWGKLDNTTDLDSLKVELPKGVRLVDKFAKVQQSVEGLNERRLALEIQLKDAHARSEALADQESVLRSQQKYLDDIQRASTTPSASEAPLPTLQQWRDLMSFAAQQRAQLLESLRELFVQQDDVRKEINKIQREISQLNVGQSMYSRQLVLKVESLRAIERASVAVTYFNYNAGWTPSYHVNVDGQTAAIELGYGAMVHQSTLADWKDVQMTLSSARPSHSATLPQLRPWWISERLPIVDNMSRMRAQNKMTLMAAAPQMEEMAIMSDAAGLSENASFEGVAVASKTTFIEMTLPQKVSLAADNEPVRVVLEQLPLEGELSYAVVPELTSDVFLQAKVTNSSQLPLLEGSAAVFVDGNFVGKSQLDEVLPAENFDLSLGSDRSVKVQRKQLAKKTDLTGFGEDKRKVTYRYEISVENLKSVELAVKVSERLPLSQHEKIKVELVEPRKMQADSEGILSWDLALKPQQKETITLVYSIEFPKDMDISGL